MLRALLALLCLLAATGSSSAAKKDKIAILGLEVVSQGTAGIDSDSTRVAQELTVGLRVRPKAGQGPYAWTPSSEKELIDEKLLNNCENEEKSCMSAIGKALGTDLLMYGKIERKSQGTKTGYQVSLRLLKISNLTLTTWTDFIPLDESVGTKLQDWARKGYKKLTNENDGGTLVIHVNADRGTILLDGEERGNITSGKGEVVNLTEGRYKVSVVSTGYQRWNSEDKIFVRNGETHTEDVVLKELPKGGPALCDPMVSTCENTTTDPPSTGFWKGMMVTGAIMVVGGGGLWTFSAIEIIRTQDKIKTENPPDGSARRTELVDRGERYSTYTKFGAAIVGVGAVVGVVGLIKGYLVTGHHEKRAAGSPTVARERKRGGMAVAPVVGPATAGAMLRFDW